MNRPCSVSDFRSLAKHFEKLAKRLNDTADSMVQAREDVVSVEANQLFNTYKTNVKKACDTVCDAVALKLAAKQREEEERAEQEAAERTANKSKRKAITE